MGKDLYPRFRCPLCGWMAHLSMLREAPHKIEIIGTQFKGFQGISYHKIWGGKKEYREFLREKIREVAEVLGVNLDDEEEGLVPAEEEDQEEIRRGKPPNQARRLAEKVVATTPSQTIIRTESIVEDTDDESAVDEVDEKLVEALRQLIKRTPSSQIDRKPSSSYISTSSMFIDLGGENNG